MSLSPDIDLEPIAGGTPGFSGADLKNLLNEAALMAARENADRVEGRHLGAARDRILLGLEREGLALEAEEIRLLAYHEAGHALLGSVLPTAEAVHKVTIIPRGRSMGSTHQIPDRERYVWRREELMDRLAMMLGGRAAEEIACETVTSGAEDELRRATELARRMVARWGMSEALGPLATAGDREVQTRAREALEHRRDELYELANLLVRKEEIAGSEVAAIVESHARRSGLAATDGDALERGREGKGPSGRFVHTS